MKKSIVFIFSLLVQFSFGQAANPYAAVDQKTAQIPNDFARSTEGIANYIESNFKSDTDKIRAVYYWLAMNVAYDVPNMFEPNQFDSTQEKIDKTLQSKKGVCIHYAEVFKDLATKLGIKTYIISGYTRQAGQVAPISHAWTASKIDGSWFLFDPTWGAGYIDKQRFFKRLNNEFFKVSPQKMIATHMPFDYMWQFLNSPWNNQEFYAGKETANKPKANFDYQLEIDKYEKLSEAEKNFQAAARVEKGGFKNQLVSDYHAYLRKQFTGFTENQNIEKLNQIVTNYNAAVSNLNDFIMYRNRNFKPAISDDALRNRMKDIKDQMNQVNDDIYKVGSVGSQNAAMLSGLKRNISQTMLEVEKQDAFLKEYLGKTKLGRKLSR